MFQHFFFFFFSLSLSLTFALNILDRATNPDRPSPNHPAPSAEGNVQEVSLFFPCFGSKVILEWLGGD